MDNLTLLLDEAEAFANSSGIKLTVISYKLFGHNDRIADYRANKHSPRLSTIAEAWEKLRAERARYAHKRRTGEAA